MGMMKRTCSIYANSSTKEASAPDPLNFILKEVFIVKQHLVALVKYPDCTNFEAYKVLVYLDTTDETLRKQLALDPHFSSDRNVVSPFAIFEPSAKGLQAAINFISRY